MKGDLFFISYFNSEMLESKVIFRVKNNLKKSERK